MVLLISSVRKVITNYCLFIISRYCQERRKENNHLEDVSSVPIELLIIVQKYAVTLGHLYECKTKRRDCWNWLNPPMSPLSYLSHSLLSTFYKDEAD